MKKFFIFIIIIIVIILLIAPEKEMRIRVIANSDSSFDQRVKVEVAKHLKLVLLETRDLSIIKEEVEYIIKKYNCDYSVLISYKDQKYDAKYIGNEIIPGGVYNTLLIELGESKGKNYWSMLYPEYFNVEFEDINSGDVEFGWWIIDFLKGEDNGNS